MLVWRLNIPFGGLKRRYSALFLMRIAFVFLGMLVSGSFARADNVAMTETSKYLAPETVSMLVARAQAGQPAGFQVGDIIKYIIKYKPVPNGGNTGANGYVTDYIPNGLQVIGAAFVSPDGAGGYVEHPPTPPGDMINDPAGNGVRNVVSATPLVPATPANTGGIGTLAQWYGDTGIWYSTDTRTAFNFGVPGASRNNWDTAELAACNAFKGAASPWGTCSPVSGPETFYQWELQANPLLPPPPAGTYNTGPWHRIAYPGSRIGDYGLMGDLQANRVLLPGDPQYGRDLATNPLPVASALTPVTIRWANGLNSVGQIKYVSVTARIASLPPGGTIINESEVWGGDVFYGEGGKDNAWKYNNTLVSIANNSSLTIIKTPSVEAAQVGGTVSFQITVVNTGAKAHTNISVVDYINTSQKVGGGGFVVMSQYNNDASGGGVYTPGPAGNTVGAENITWTIPLLNPGQSQTFTYSVTALTPPNPKISDAADRVVATSTQLPLPGAIAAASYTIGTFPLLSQTKTVTPSSILPGGTVRYHIQITNTGGGYAGTYHTTPLPGITYYPINALGLPIPTTIEDTLPAGFTYMGNPSLTINGAPVLGSTLTALGNKVTWSIPHTLATPNEIAPGAVLDLYFDAQASAGLAAGTYTNTVYTTVPYNKKPKNKAPKAKNWATKPLWSINTAPVTVGAVQMDMVANPATVVNGATGTSTSYTITVNNNGATTATGVAVSATLPTGFSYTGNTTGTAGVGAPTIAGQTLTWPAFNIPAGSAATIVFTANIASSVFPGVFRSDLSATSTSGLIPGVSQTAPVTVTLPGITVSKTVDRPTIPWLGAGAVAPVSDTVNYTITVRNSGTAYGTVDISDQLPAGFYFPPLGVETVTMTTGGVPQVMTRGPTDTSTTYKIYPGSNPLLPLIAPGTRTPHWGTFTIPPKQGTQDSILTITFPVRVDMQQVPAAGTVTVTQPGTYDNTVTIAGNSVVPVFTGAPVTISQSASKWTTTPNVAVGGLIDYYVQVQNVDAYAWSGVSVVDYLGSLANGAIAAVPSGATYSAGTAFYAIASSLPAANSPLWTPIVPTAGVNTLTFTLPPLVSIPAGQSLFVTYKAIAPAAVPVPATIHNSVQSVSYTSNLVAHTINTAWNGGLAANTAEDVTISATPSVSISGSKTVTPEALHLYGAAAPNAVTYSITLTNPDPVTAATGVLITDTLAPGFSFGVGDTASVSINGGLPTPLVPVWTPPAVVGGSGTLAIPVASIPAGGTAVITFTVSVAAATAANTYYNSFTIAADPAVATSNILSTQVGPTAPLVVDPVHVNKVSTTKNVVAGGKAYYQLTVSNTAPFGPNTTINAGATITDALPAGFTYGATTSVKVNGVTVPPTSYITPTVGSTAPTWTLNQSIPGAQAGVNTVMAVDFYANVAPTVVPGTYNNSISNLTYTVGATPVTALNPYNGALAQNTGDDVTVTAVGISKSVVSPYSNVVNTTLGTSTQYEIVVNNSSAAIQTVNVQDNLPTGFSIPAVVAPALGNYYYTFSATPPLTAPPAAPWIAATAAVPAAGAPVVFDNAAAGFAIPAGQNLYLRFTANIASTVTAGTYNNQADVRLTAAPAVTVASVSGAPVTVTAPQAFLSKITTTPDVGKDVNGNYGLAHYKVSVTNVGTADATGIVLTDTLPVGFTLSGQPVVTVNGVPLANTAFSATVVGQNVTFDTVPAGGFTVPAANANGNGLLVIEYDASIAPTTVATIAGYTNSVSGTTTNAGLLAAATANVKLHDVGLSKTTSTATVNPGGIATYTITVSNFGAAAIANVVVTDYLPAGFSYILGSTLLNGVAAADPSLVNGASLPLWTIPNLLANSAATITFNAQVSSAVADGNYFNSVVATGAAGAVSFPSPGPTAKVVVQTAQPLLTILKQASAATAQPGSNIIYTVTVSNTGPGVANTVDITDFMSPYTKLALNPFANGSIFKFIDGANTSGLPGTATVSYSNDGGATYNYTPVDDGTGHDPAITNFRLMMNGVMNANQAANPSFSIQYQVQVK
jgi:uncharacterized repeat protein (TIGR01451 family)/fimbrial isopeptide formation D2 family protein